MTVLPVLQDGDSNPDIPTGHAKEGQIVRDSDSLRTVTIIEHVFHGFDFGPSPIAPETSGNPSAKDFFRFLATRPQPTRKELFPRNDPGA